MIHHYMVNGYEARNNRNRRPNMFDRKKHRILRAIVAYLEQICYNDTYEECHEALFRDHCNDMTIFVKIRDLGRHEGVEREERVADLVEFGEIERRRRGIETYELTTKGEIEGMTMEE